MLPPKCFLKGNGTWNMASACHGCTDQPGVFCTCLDQKGRYRYVTPSTKCIRLKTNLNNCIYFEEEKIRLNRRSQHKNSDGFRCSRKNHGAGDVFNFSRASTMAFNWKSTVSSAASGTNRGSVWGMARRTIIASRLRFVNN